MKPSIKTEPVTVALTRAEAIVLFELLYRQEGRFDAFTTEGGEQLSLSYFLCTLEDELHEPFRDDWLEILDRSRKEIVSDEGGS